MICDIKINEFEGPLDLLLHLIKENNLDINNIDVQVITGQYLTYIDQMESLNINVASSYLVMASELIYLKSKSLLPKDDSKEEKEEEITKEKLINQLLEYQRYKELAQEFSFLLEKRKEIYIKLPEKKDLYINHTIKNNDQSLDDLIKSFENYLERTKLSKPLTTKVTSREYNTKERSNEIKNILLEKKTVNFVSLFTKFEKDYIIITFLTILEMVKNKEINISQSSNFNEIKIELRGNQNE